MNKSWLGVFFIMVVGCKEQTRTAISMKEDVQFLASDSLKGRETGTSGEIAAAEYISSRFEQIGLSKKGQQNSYFQTFSFKPKSDPHQQITFTNDQGDQLITGTNVIGFLNNEAKHTVVIGAHYDHLGMGGEGSLHREGEAIHNGADDNASGVAIMLALADTLMQAKKLQNNYLFIAFSGEEMGLLGSNYFTKNATLPLDGLNYMINMDMVGRLNEERALAVHGVGTSPVFSQSLFSNNEDFKLIEHESGVGPSDHTSFYLNDIPVLHFFTGQHADYHRPGDDTEKLNYTGMNDIKEFIYTLMLDLDDNGALAFRKTKDESEDVPRFKVALGVVPDYLFDGKGMRIDGVSENKPAQQAELKKGDVVIQLGAQKVTDMMSYMKALSTFEEKDTTTVTVKRKDTILKRKITF